MKTIKISVIGNSVALRVRPPQKRPLNQNYSQLLENYLNEDLVHRLALVNNYSISRALVTEMYKKREKFIRSFPDFYIINLGVCDASTRGVPLWFANIIKRREIPILTGLFSKIYYKIIKRNLTFFVKLRNKRPWISIKLFEKYYLKLIKYLLKETNARIILLPINPTTQIIENIIPGSKLNFCRYNKIISTVAKQYSFFYIQLNDLSPQIHCPDGIHSSLEGRKKVASRLYKSIKEKI
jgi:lysophospholipase L1-like esterase